MGAWGYEPYANDTACGFFAVAMRDPVPLPDQIGWGLEESDDSDVRAAAFLLEKIGYGYVYPHDKREKHLELAISKLQRMLESGATEEWNEPDTMRAEIRRQIDALRVRLSREDENILTRKIKEGMGDPKTSVYDSLAWALGQLEERYAGHAEGDLPVELRVAKAILEQRADKP